MNLKVVASPEKKYSIWSLLSVSSANGPRRARTVSVALECPHLVSGQDGTKRSRAERIVVC